MTEYIEACIGAINTLARDQLAAQRQLTFTESVSCLMESYPEDFEPIETKQIMCVAIALLIEERRRLIGATKALAEIKRHWGSPAESANILSKALDDLKKTNA